MMSVPNLRLVTVDGVRAGYEYSERDLFVQEQLRISARYHREEAMSQKGFWLAKHATMPQSAEADLMFAFVEYGAAMHLRAAELLERVHRVDQFTKEVREQAAALGKEAVQAFAQAGKLMMKIENRVA